MSNDFLNQDEIDALLRGDEPLDSQSNQSETTMPTLSDMESDTLSEIGTISMGSASTALSMLINRKVTITVPEVYVSTVNTIRENYPIPCLVVNVEYKAGLQGANLLVIKERDAAVIGNLMMGEDGKNPPEEIDELYLSAVTECMNMMMGSAATSMSDLFHYMIDISPPVTYRKDLSSDKFNFIETDKPIAVIAFRIEIEELIDSVMLQIIDLDFAKDMVDQLLNPRGEETSEEPKVDDTAIINKTPSDEVTPSDWADLQQHMHPNTDVDELDIRDALGNLNVDLIRDIPVRVRAILGKTKMSIENILKLGPGHIMELETIEGDPIDVYANDTLIARGEVVVVDEQFGIRITEITTPRNRINSIR